MDMTTNSNQKPKLKLHETIWVMLPIGLIVIGGALGGFLGSLVMCINFKLFRSNQPTAVKYILSVFALALAACTFIAICTILGHLYPQFFAKHH